MNTKAFAANDALVSFQTDFCTGIPEGTPSDREAWKNCCLLHDMLFWAGGDRDDRDAADLTLKTCVEESGYPHIARVIYHAVRLGSYSPIKFENKKWNFGWPERPTHQKLTAADVDRIEAEILLESYPYPLEVKLDLVHLLRTRN